MRQQAALTAVHAKQLSLLKQAVQDLCNVLMCLAGIHFPADRKQAAHAMNGACCVQVLVAYVHLEANGFHAGTISH